MGNLSGPYKAIACILLFQLTISCNLTEQYIQKSEKTYEKLGTRSQYVETDSAKVFVRRIGDAKNKLVLIHGFGPLPQVQWEDLTEELHNDFEIIIPDLIYFGNSISNSKDYSVQFQARQMAKVLSEIEVERFYIAGLSYGGMVSALMAHNHPNEVEGLILIDALSKYSDRSYTDSLARANGAEDAADFLLPENGKGMKRLFKLTYFKPPKYPAFLLNKPAQVLYKDPKGHKNAMIQHLRNNEDLLKESDVQYEGPVQIIWGKADRLIPPENAVHLSEYYPNSRLQFIEKSAHVPNIENSKEVADIILKFFNTLKNKP
ncbi:MAG: alpha/beta hydrolase [Bacteroidota bacterium]